MTAVEISPEEISMPQTFMVTEENFAKREWGRNAIPVYRVAGVARFFFGMSDSWLRLMLKADPDHPNTWFTNPDGSRMVFNRLNPDNSVSARVFRLSDIEPMAWSLYRFGAITATKLAMVLRVVEAQAVLYEFVTVDGRPVEDTDE